MKNKKYHTVSEQFQNPIVKIVKGSKIIAIFGPRHNRIHLWMVLIEDSALCCNLMWPSIIISEEKFEDTKEEIRSCISNERQWIGQKKKDKRTNNDLQNGVNRN